MTRPAPGLAEIDAVRRFNRFATDQAGTLNAALLGSGRSLAEARVPWELGHSPPRGAAEFAGLEDAARAGDRALTDAPPRRRAGKLRMRLVSTCIETARALGCPRLDLWLHDMPTAARALQAAESFAPVSSAPAQGFRRPQDGGGLGRSSGEAVWRLDLVAATAPARPPPRDRPRATAPAEQSPPNRARRTDPA
ncbi:MAG: hypothetical protein CML46_00850 [Rhodobacteraceae bacterium]|nr:hypothetical protein [Paracoccaceae bacterium]MBR25492.1 hypothetical protein [Paracoccaceae bacterium]